jgi:hypothetical protein
LFESVLESHEKNHETSPERAKDEICRMNADGTNQTQITTHSQREQYPDWQNVSRLAEILLPSDTIDTSQLVFFSPLNTTVDVTDATADPSDPVISCTSQQHYNTVWYKVQPAISGQLTADTYGSNYDTVLAIWHDTGSLVEQGCQDAYILGGVYTSWVSVPVIGGETYYIEVASDTADTSNKTLQLYVSLTP